MRNLRKSRGMMAGETPTMGTQRTGGPPLLFGRLTLTNKDYKINREVKNEPNSFYLACFY